MESLEKLKTKIEEMPQYHQLEVFSILKTNDELSISENNNGTFINLTQLKKDVIDSLTSYVKYVDEQKCRLDIVEIEKKRLEKEYFNKDLKDNVITNSAQ